EFAAAGEGQFEFGVVVEEGAEEHDDRAGSAGGVGVDAGEVEFFGRGDLEVAVGADPAVVHAHARQDAEDAVDLFDAGDAAERGGAVGEEAGAQEGDAGVFGGLDVDGAGEGDAAADAQVEGGGRGAGAGGGVEHGVRLAESEGSAWWFGGTGGGVGVVYGVWGSLAGPMPSASWTSSSSSSMTAATAGRRAAPRRVTARKCRMGVKGPETGMRMRSRWGGRSTRRGMRAMPSPWATMMAMTVHSRASPMTVGRNPAL